MFLSSGKRFQSGLLAGLSGGFIASVLMLLLSVTLNGISLPEVFGSALTGLMSASLFSYLHQLIGGDAKYYLFIGIFIGQCLVFSLSGGIGSLVAGRIYLSRKAVQEGQISWPSALVLAFVLWLATGLLFLPLIGAGVFGSVLAIGAWNTLWSLAVVGITFGWLFVSLYNWLIQRQLRKQGVAPSENAQDKRRRLILKTGLEIAGVGVLGALMWRFITSGGVGSDTASNLSVSKVIQQFKKKITPPPTPNYGTIEQVPLLSPEITPNDQYYIVSKNLLSDPVVDGTTWKLVVNGQVQQPLVLTYQQLLALPMHTQYESMMCISNEVGGQYMSNAKWEGVRLADLLEKAGMKPGATKVVLYASDDYSDSIHLSKALEETTLLAVRMNDQTLPSGHGYPARLLVPGIYGMKHVKWITRIEVVNTDYQGYWQQRGWSDAAPIRLTSRIDTPLIGSTLKANKPTYIAGVAFSGNQGISEVDVSLDNGQTWQRATLKQPLSALSWVLWQLPWQPSSGTYTLMVRAVDLAGNVQDPHIAPPAPDGSSGYHTITVTAQ